MIDWAGVITASVSGIVSLVTLYRMGHMKVDVTAVKADLTEVKKSMDVVTAHTNGMVTAITQMAEAKGVAVGKAEGRAEIREEIKAANGVVS